MLWIGFLILAYLVGSIPFGLLIGLAKGVDIRDAGSGNIGATNAGRVLGRTWGIICFILDMGKGLGPTLGYGFASGVIAYEWAGSIATAQWLAVGVAAVLGHVLSIFLGFRGGKGVATAAGALLGIYPLLTTASLVAALVWYITVKRSGYVGLASVVAAAVLPLLVAVVGLSYGRPLEQWLTLAVLCLPLSTFVVYKHRDNIRRLRAGTESKVAWAGKRHKAN